MGKEEREKTNNKTNKTSAALLRSLLFAGKFAKRVLETVENVPVSKVASRAKSVCALMLAFSVYEEVQKIQPSFKLKRKCNIQFGSEERKSFETQLSCSTAYYDPGK